MVAKGALHCGSGCTLGDLLAEWLAFAVPAVALWFGYQTLFSEKMFAVWILDFVFAFVFGIAFQRLQKTLRTQCHHRRGLGSANHA
jgi:Domain of unknown function (DUF4396)